MITINKYIKALLNPAGGHQGSHKAHQAGNQNKLIIEFAKPQIYSPQSYPSKKAGCSSLQYSPNSHPMHTQCSSNAHLVQGHIFRNFLAIHT